MTTTNLGTGNTYWIVTSEFPLFVRTGFAESNTYVGASRMLSAVYCRTTARVGDELCSLVGGTFLRRRGSDTAVPVRLHVSDKHPFEKVYVPPTESWPLSSLRGCENAPCAYDTTQPVLTTADVQALPGRTYHGIDISYEDA